MTEQQNYEFFEEPDEQHITVDKLTCARTQIDTAIDLYFRDGDPVSIHTLACAAFEILKNLNAKRGGKPLLLEFAFLDKPEQAGLRKSVIDQMKSFQNFFKHADRDPDATKQFRPRLNEYWLFYCIDAYIKIAPVTHNMAFYNLWFIAMHHDILTSNLQTSSPGESQQLIQITRQKYNRASKQSYFLKMLRDYEP
jgi:hypothetical protein